MILRPLAASYLFGLIVAALGVLGLPDFSSAQCDPARGRVFMLAESTGMASLTLKNMEEVPGRPIVVGRGTLKLLDGTTIAVETRANIRPNARQTVSYKIKGSAQPWRVRGTIRLKGCPAAIDQVKLSVRAPHHSPLAAKDLSLIGLAATPSVNAVLLDAADVDGLLPLMTDDAHLGLPSDDPLLPSLRIGTVMIAGITPTTPEGLLREIVDIVPQGSVTLLVTRPSTLLDAFEQLDVEASGDPGMQIRGPGPRIVVAGDRSIVFPGLHESRTIDFVDAGGMTVTVSGTLDFESSLAFGIHIHTVALVSPVLDSFHMELHGVLGAEVTAKASYAASIAQSQTLYTMPLGIYDVGPLILRPKFVIVAGAAVNLAAGITAKATASSSGFVGVMYDGVDWMPEKVLSRQLDGSLTIEQGGSATAYLQPELTIELYDHHIVGGDAHVGVRPYVRMVADITADPWWNLYGGLQADFGVGASILGHQIAGYDNTVPIVDLELNHSTDAAPSCCNPGGTPPEATPNATSTPTPTPTPICLTGPAAPGCLSGSSLIDTFAETGTSIFQPSGLDVAPTGEIYVSHTGTQWGMSRRDCSGLVTTIYGGNPGPVRVAPDGSVYFIEIDRDCCGNAGASTVFAGGPAGPMARIAGRPYSAGYSGDGGPAVDAQIVPVALAIDADGILYIAGGGRIRRVGLDGIITTYAGTGNTSGPLGDGGLAIDASLDPADIDIGLDGSMYVADRGHGGRIRKISPAGTITTIGGGTGCIYGCDYRFPPCAEDVPAIQACISAPEHVRIDPNGSVFVNDFAYIYRIREITPAGMIRTIAGTGSFDISGDGGPAASASVAVSHMALGPDGSLYTAECTGYYCGNGRVRHIACAD